MLGQAGGRELAGAKAALAAAVLGARDIIAPHIVGQRDIGIAGGADPFGRELEAPDFRGAEMLDDLRTGMGRAAAIENAGGRQAADGVGPGRPRLRAFTARLVQLEHAVRHGKAEIQGDPPARDDRPGPVIDLSSGFVLVEAEMDEAAQEISRLGNPAGDRPADPVGDRIGRSRIILRGIAEEGAHIAERRESDAQDQRILGGEHHLVEQLGIEAVLEADLGRVGGSGKWMLSAAFGEGPVGGRNFGARADHASGGLGCMGGEARLLGIERDRPIGQRIGVHDHGLRIGASGIEDAPHDAPGDRRPIGILRHRHDDIVVVGPRRGPARIVALPAAGKTDVAGRALERPDGDPAAAIGHVVPHQAARPRHVDRLHQLKRGGVLDHPTRIAGRELDVLDDRIVRIVRIELPEGAPGQGFVGAGAAEARPVEGGRHLRVDDDLGHPRLRGDRAGRQHGCGRDDPAKP
ncbi:MAG TPA: hypothetical protein VG291_15905 [Xanthobacteraceae bacterium]|nr:hypothetical protein [Xanthobacteraceae bacterium]